jgi:hypothetical protein
MALDASGALYPVNWRMKKSNETRSRGEDLHGDELAEVAVLVHLANVLVVQPGELAAAVAAAVGKRRVRWNDRPESPRREIESE